MMFLCHSRKVLNWYTLSFMSYALLTIRKHITCFDLVQYPPQHFLKSSPVFTNFFFLVFSLALSQWQCVWENGGSGKGLFAFQLLSTMKKGTSPFKFQSDEPFFTFLRQQMAISKFNLTRLGKVRGAGGRGSTLPSLWISVRALNALIRNLINPLRSLYDHPFYINLICPQGLIYNPCPGWSRGVFILKYKISGPSNYAEQNGYVKILIGCV